MSESLSAEELEEWRSLWEGTDNGQEGHPERMLATIDALQAENARLREQADALADALGGVTYSGPICFPEDGGRCHWCEGKEEHGHADHCDWIRADAALRTYREANRG